MAAIVEEIMNHEMLGLRPSDDVELSDSLPIAAEDDLSEIEGEASTRLVSIVESLLFAANKALGVREIRQLLKDASHFHPFII